MNLDRLLADARLNRTPEEPVIPVPPACRDMAQALPLTHALTSDAFVEIAADRKKLGWKLLSPENLILLDIMQRRLQSTEAFMGTEGFVFLFCGQFRYPETQVGFLFATGLEQEYAGASEASPFDSGALREHAVWPDPSESARDFLARHTLPVPEYREYLAHRLHYLFAKPSDYLGQDTAPIRSDPLGLAPKQADAAADPRLWTFEIRIKDEVILSKPYLVGIFYAARLERHPGARKFLSALDGDVHQEPIFEDDADAFGALQIRCLDFLRERGIVR